MTPPAPAADARPATATQAQAAAHDPSSASVGELAGSITKDLSTLMRQELDLAKAEVKQEAIKSGKAAGLYGAAGFAGYMVLLFASIALWWGLANVMDQGWAALIVTGVWAVIGAVTYSAGRRQARQIHPKPERTVETVKEIPDALKGQAGNSA
jgi:Putative Actinobacterial Holin-X, holin superfamily III